MVPGKEPEPLMLRTDRAERVETEALKGRSEMFPNN